MPVLLLGLGFMMTIVGLYAVYAGWGIVVLERGWTMIIAGSVVATGGVIVATLGLLLGDLRRVLAQRPVDVGHARSTTAASIGMPAISNVDNLTAAPVAAAAGKAPRSEATVAEAAIAAPASAETTRPVALEGPEPLLTTLLRNEPPPSPLANVPGLKSSITAPETVAQPDLPAPTTKLPPLDALRSVLDMPMPFEDLAETPRPGTGSDRFAELLRPLRELVEPPAPTQETIRPALPLAADASEGRANLHHVSIEASRVSDPSIASFGDISYPATPEPIINILPPIVDDAKSSQTPKSGQGGGLADRWLHRSRGGKRSDKNIDAAILAIETSPQVFDVPAQSVTEMSGPIVSEPIDIDLPQTDWQADSGPAETGQTELPAPADESMVDESAKAGAAEMAGTGEMAGAAEYDTVRPEPAMDIPTVVKTYTAGGHTYMMFSDGSIEADTPEGVFKFGSIDELKAFIASRAGDGVGA